MTTYPLPTLAPTVDANGITAPSFEDILLSLQASYQAIYGSDANLDPSTQDGQWLAIQAKAQFDSNQATIATYNQFSPATAQGIGLSSVVKINGIARLVPSNSSAIVTIVGQAGTTIVNGLVGDNQGLGTQWALPASVVIPGGGSIAETVTCTTQGAVAAAANTLTVILTPTAGWQTVNNAADAAKGAPTESDAALRRRQSNSTSIPAQTVLSAILGELANLTGVTAVTAVENDTASTDGNGIPSHSIAVVIEGGDAQTIANTIGAKKTPGAGTFGTTSETYVDPYGISHTIAFSVPSQKRILVAISLHALTGYTTAVGQEIQASLAAYINALGIGADVLITRLFGPALLLWPGYVPANPADQSTFELVTVHAAISPGSPGSSDLVIAYNELATCLASDVTISVV